MIVSSTMVYHRRLGGDSRRYDCGMRCSFVIGLEIVFDIILIQLENSHLRPCSEQRRGDSEQRIGLGYIQVGLLGSLVTSAHGIQSFLDPAPLSGLIHPPHDMDQLLKHCHTFQLQVCPLSIPRQQ